MRHRTVLAMLAAHAIVVALAAVFFANARVAVAAAFFEYGTEPPVATRLALTGWFLPAGVGAGVVLAVLAGALPLRRSRRMRLWAAGIVVSSAVFVFAVIATFAPVFRP